MHKMRIPLLASISVTLISTICAGIFSGITLPIWVFLGYYFKGNAADGVLAAILAGFFGGLHLAILTVKFSVVPNFIGLLASSFF